MQEADHYGRVMVFGLAGIPLGLEHPGEAGSQRASSVTLKVG
jgi:hypothetical protein